MADKLILENGLRAIFDQDYMGFYSFPNSRDEAIQRWVSAISNYATGILPGSSTIKLGELSLASQLKTISDTLGDGLSKLELGITLYASSYSMGIASYSSGTLVGIPPPLPLSLPYLETMGKEGQSSKAIAVYISTTIHQWLKTGTATNISTGLTINWN